VNTSQELSRLQGHTAHSSSGHRLTGIEAGPFRQNGIQGKPATPPSARPPSHSTSTSTARAGWFENLHLRHKMVLGLSVLAIAGLALAAVAYNTIQKVKIGGSSYAEIVVWKDLNADILRPPLYIIDMHRTVLAMAAETDQPESGKGQALREQFALLRKDYDERHRHWGSTLATGNMRQALLVESHAPVEAFVKAYDTQFLPLVLKREHQKSTEVALGVLTNEFEKHRVALDKAVQIGRREQAQIEQAASGTEEMGASIKEIAKSVQDAAKVAATAVRAAETTNATISKLGDSSAEIGKVIKVITSIAQQTNLLALNATIEAARAGEAGKGFAVVANEVKELAKETAKATEYISQKIEAIQSETKMAVDAIAEIGTVINKISDYQNTIASAVEEQTATTNEISRNVTEAARGSTEIAQNITGVATSARSTSAGAHDTQKAAGELSRMAAELQSIVTLHGS
jgi:hypothetical protein